MQRHLDHLNRRIIPRLDGEIRRERDLGETEGAREGIARGTRDLEDGEHLVREVARVVAEVHVEVEEGGGVAAVPARHDFDGSAGDGPECAVLGYGHAAAYEG